MELFVVESLLQQVVEDELESLRRLVVVVLVVQRRHLLLPSFPLLPFVLLLPQLALACLVEELALPFQLVPKMKIEKNWGLVFRKTIIIDIIEILQLALLVVELALQRLVQEPVLVLLQLVLVLVLQRLVLVLVFR